MPILGHVYTAIGDYPNALAAHKQCVQLVKQQNDKLQEAREIGNVGAVYLAMGEFENAVDCHNQHLRLAKRLNNKVSRLDISERRKNRDSDRRKGRKEIDKASRYNGKT